MTLEFSSTGLEVPEPVRAQLLEDDVAARLVRKDATLWGPDAESEAAIRLGWLDLPSSSRSLVDQLAQLREQLLSEGLDRIVLCGMGGSSLAPEVICRTAGVPLVVLDTTDPGQVAAAMTDLERTVVVVSSKSGGTVETDSHRRAFASAFAAAGLDEQQVGARFVVVTDPDSPLSETAAAMGARARAEGDPAYREARAEYAAIRELAQQLDLRPTKSLGQNFRHDANTIRRIVRTAGLRADDVVLEVGPGLGSLTLGLLPAAARVVAVEIDPRLADLLPRTVAERRPDLALGDLLDGRVLPEVVGALGGPATVGEQDPPGVVGVHDGSSCQHAHIT